ncbi:MAG: excinuclease ABC subunit C [Halobacteriales archaeon]|nr:excinuclease ABC subunit C [Halobacteriales archaeon]
MDPADVRARANELPDEPGVYQFLAGDTVLYVGKAVELRDRVRSYADPRSERIGRMVERADTIDIAVTDTETQALLLEANLIKRHQPRYNVRLKDDKSYPMVQLTAHPVPRIEITRDPEENATVYGPFTDVGRVKTVVKALRETYGLRGCSDHKYSGRDRPCLDYDLGLCTAPCTGEISEADYRGDVESVKRFFEGETGILSDPIERAMEEAAADQSFERAANLRDRLEAIEAFHGGGAAAVSDPDGGHTMDVLGAVVEGERATVARLHAEGGQLIDRDRHHLDTPDAEEAAPAVLGAFIPQYYAERSLPDVLVVSDRPDDETGDLEAWLAAEGVDLRVPGAGRKAKLVDLALRNARQHDERDEIATLAEALDIPRPERIEGFDVSHAQGKAVVGSNVVFVDGQPAKADYRRKKLDDRNDDYANMYDLLAWRASRAVEGRDDRPAPDLLLIDGGEGQLDAARDALEAVGWDVPVIALAKADERVITPDGSQQWPDDATHLHVLQRVRDEAHRFAVQYHQTVRDTVETVLDDIPGIGPSKRRRLLRRFGSVDGVRAASIEELQDVPGIGADTAATIEQRL